MRKPVGKVLQEARLRAGLSARDVERLINMPTGVLSQIENGVRKDPGFSTVLKLARALGASMEDIARGVEGRPVRSGPASPGSVAKALRLIQKAHSDCTKAIESVEVASQMLAGHAPQKKR